MPTKFDLAERPIHLGVGARCVVLPPFDGSTEWYERYEREHRADGAEGRLVSIYSFSEDWRTWEMHPRGSELVYVISGRMTLIQRHDGADVAIELGAGEAAINEPGTWHTAKVAEPTSALFITAGEGTEHALSPPARRAVAD